ncbi:DMT family transporter [Tomitella gaofuii]|uniref:DMT family transporter n=1 Tax=Tomitella gaofuii TaxID=2760083 RepID=UPI0015FABA6B|nr:DMT family transporter [Tomitella gaofuii]
MAFRSPSRTLAPHTPATPTSATGAPTVRPGLDPRLIAAAGAASISLTAVFTKLVDASTATVVFYRCLLAVLPLAFLAYAEIRRNGTPSRRTVALHALGGVFLGLDFALWTQSIAMIGAGIATILNNVQVLVVPLLAWAFFRDKIPMRFVISVPVMFLGIALAGGVLGGESAAGSDPLAGTALGLLSGVAFAGYIIIIGRTGKASGGGANSQVLVATITAGMVGTAFGTAWGGIDFTPGWGAIGWLAALALVGQVLGWVLLGASLPKLPSQVGASMLLLQPALAVVFAMIILGERPTSAQLLGCVVVIAAVAVVAFEPRRLGTRSSGSGPTPVDVGDDARTARWRRLRGRRATGIRPVEIIESDSAAPAKRL